MSENPPLPGGDLGLASLTDLVEIGRGGFATVYRAHQPRFGRTVAVKVLDPGADRLSLERFERECEAMGMLSSHPNIVTIFDAGVTADGKPFLIMELMPEGSLDDRVAGDGPLPWDEVTEIGVKLAGALETAHGATVLHRDVKPANVLRSSFGEPCLSDFGLARFASEAKTTGVVTATLLHAPPEILSGEPATPQSDVYSLASSLHTLLAGDAPFWKPTDESLLPLLARIAGDPVPDLRPRGVPDELAAAVEAGMAKDPTDRPASAAAFGQLLQEAQAAAGLPATVLPLAGQASVRKARRAAGAPTDPDQTIGRPGAPTDPDQTIVRRPKLDPTPPAPEPVQTEHRRRWPLALAGLVVVAALFVGAVLVLGGGDGNGDDTTVSAEDGSTEEVATSPSTPAQLRGASDQLVDQLNDVRVDADVGEVTVDDVLTQEARRFAADAAEVQGFPEIDRDQLPPGRWGRVGVVTTAGSSPQDAFDNAVDSDQTLPTLVDPQADVTGIGLARAGDGSYYLVVLLGQSLTS